MNRAARWLLTLLVFCLALAPGKTQSEDKPGTKVQFPLLPGLEHRVEFWKKVFTEYSLSQLVFFDPFEMSKIYEVLDVGEETSTPESITGERERIAALHGVDLERVRAQRGIKERTAAGIKRSGRYIAQM